jgi:ADP-heptose:LPS heptosyltransferase
MPAALVLRALGLGDLLVTVPALRALRRALPRHRLVLAAPPQLEQLAMLIGAVDRVVPCEARLGVPSPGSLVVDAPVDVAVNLHGRGPQSTQLLKGTHPRWIVTYASAGVPGPTWDPTEHEVDRWLRLVATGTGVQGDPRDLRLDVPVRGPGAAVVHPGTFDPARRWPPDRFAEVAIGLERRGIPVVVTGTAPERRLAERVAARARLPRSRVLAGTTDSEALLSVVARAPIVVSGDTGVMHVAIALGRPSVHVFGPTDPAGWGPRFGPHVTLRAPRGSLPALTSAEVIGAVDLLLGRRNARQRLAG